MSGVVLLTSTFRTEGLERVLGKDDFSLMSQHTAYTFIG